MIFPALHRFALSRGLLDDLDFTEQTIHAVIDLRADGAFVGLQPVGDKKNPVKRGVSRIAARNSSAIACLGADTANRVVPGLEPNAKGITIATQALFLEQLRAAHSALQHSGLAAVVAFLARLPGEPALADTLRSALEAHKLKLSDWLTFRVEGHDGYVIEWSPLKSWWRGQCAAKRAEAATSASEPLLPCMVTGELCAPIRTHGTRVKVAPGGLPGGVALVSSDKPAFGSYGFDKALVSPMSEAAVEGYIRALNFLGERTHPDHHYRTADTIFLFWCERPDLTINPAKAVEEGNASAAGPEDFLAELIAAVSAPPVPVVPQSDSPAVAVATMRSADRGAVPAGAEAARARFYCLALSGSSARGVIRGWIDQPLGDAMRNMREWFEDLTLPLDRPIFDPGDKTKDSRKRRRLAEFGANWSRWPLWQLLSILEGKGDTTAELMRLRPLLFECALLGRARPVPQELLLLACRRIATSGDSPPARAALIQLLLRRHLFQTTQPKLTMPETDQHIQNSAAFACGRLLRVLERIQQRALGDRNASVVDKFYSSASATPGAVLGLLVANAQPHLAKLRKDPASVGLAHWFDAQLADIAEVIVNHDGYPKTNDPIGQGEFALGFYYQRVLGRRQKPEAEDDSASEPAA